MNPLPNEPTALIFGVSGQDGAYLARFLLEKGYRVIGTRRVVGSSDARNLRAVNIDNDVSVIPVSISNGQDVYRLVSDTVPDEVYNLAGVSSVGLSFEQPALALESISLGTLNILEALRMSNSSARAFFAGSGECFGNTPSPANEKTSFCPSSPYAVAKTSAYWLTRNYRETFGLFACTGILFNHESPLRSDRFVTSRIIKAAKSIANGDNNPLVLGDISVVRDWGWAPEYVEAMWLMLQQDKPDDFILATGHSHSLESLVDRIFRSVRLDWREHVSIDRSRFRPTDVRESRANPDKARDVLNWKARTDIDGLVDKLMRRAGA